MRWIFLFLFLNLILCCRKEKVLLMFLHIFFLKKLHLECGHGFLSLTSKCSQNCLRLQKCMKFPEIVFFRLFLNFCQDWPVRMKNKLLCPKFLPKSLSTLPIPVFEFSEDDRICGIWLIEFSVFSWGRNAAFAKNLGFDFVSLFHFSNNFLYYISSYYHSSFLIPPMY